MHPTSPRATLFIRKPDDRVERLTVSLPPDQPRAAAVLDLLHLAFERAGLQTGGSRAALTGATVGARHLSQESAPREREVRLTLTRELTEAGLDSLRERLARDPAAAREVLERLGYPRTALPTGAATGTTPAERELLNQFGEDSELAQGLPHWPGEQVARMAARLSGEGLSQVVREARAFRIPESHIPLLKESERRPLAPLDDATVIAVILNALAYPEKEGILTRIVREVIGVQPEQAGAFRRIETHFDSIPRMTPAVQRDSIQLGFEHDNFHEFVPQNYQDHYTLRFNVPQNQRSRYEHLRHIAESHTATLETHVDGTPDADGYVEYEYYRSDSQIAQYAYRPVTPETLRDFPFQPGALEVMEVPNTKAEAERSGMPLEVHKRADIHVEIPSTSKGAGFAEAESPAMNGLRDRLLEMGFYQVKDVWGDTIYTAQFTDLREAMGSYRLLDAFFRANGGATSMYVEPCSRVWRKETPGVDEAVFANVPPLVRLTPAGRERIQEVLQTLRTRSSED